jgi:hypothetical protein
VTRVFYPWQLTVATVDEATFPKLSHCGPRPWAATDSVSNKTMIFDNQRARAEGPDGEARKIILA